DRSACFNGVSVGRVGLGNRDGFGGFVPDFLDLTPDPTARHTPFLLYLFGDVDRPVDRDRKCKTHGPAGPAVDHRVDTDDLALQVEQGATGVAGIDRNIGLDIGHQVFVRQLATLGDDNARRDGVFESEWLAYRGHPFTHLELFRIADGYPGQTGGLDFEQRNVGAF